MEFESFGNNPLLDKGLYTALPTASAFKISFATLVWARAPKKCIALAIDHLFNNQVN